MEKRSKVVFIWRFGVPFGEVGIFAPYPEEFAYMKVLKLTSHRDMLRYILYLKMSILMRQSQADAVNLYTYKYQQCEQLHINK